ncbi:hypothetical protein [Azospirillum lipoferum]|uniref:Uncharacterized protein n=1 Tax=Azospirillum lipoferum (strain 4B) TaxID=862719 RepID=G7ZBY9_AZOL4|nr:hypothetical protein [Azospirillum lipoferum]CBS88991.1 protein of unknown function [Azospirillum lipoferum 4B]
MSAIEAARFENGEPLPYIRLGDTHALGWTADGPLAVHTPPLAAGVVRVACSAPCRIAIGPDATATAGDAILCPFVIERFVVRGGDRVSVWTDDPTRHLGAVTVTSAGGLAS